MRSLSQLEGVLKKINRRGYKAYKELEGRYELGDGVVLDIFHVQGDPFASPTRVRLLIPLGFLGYPDYLFSTTARKYAFEDFLLRVFDRLLKPFSRVRGTGKSGLYFVDSGAQEVLIRSDCTIGESRLEVRFSLGLPARGRTIMADVAGKMLLEEVPSAVRRLRWAVIDGEKADEFVKVVEDFEFIQDSLREKGIVAFVADGSLLPRRSGVDDRPLLSGKRFASPESLKVAFETPNHGLIEGMGIPEGVTLIVGGGFHGKSTLLQAIEKGIYPHIPGDGREFVVTVNDAVKVRSEDGRYVEGVDISPFIHNLPLDIDVTFFSTENASGSTSVAASIMESLEMGASLLLLDEDTTATNFLIRDARIQRLIEKDKEPITPFIDRVRELYERLGVSTVMVVGGSGDYLDVADTVIAMKDFLPEDVTKKAREIAEELPTRRVKEVKEPLGKIRRRIVLPETFEMRRKTKVKSRGLREIVFGDEVIDVSFVEQLVDNSQARAIAEVLKFYKNNLDNIPMSDFLKKVEARIKKDKFDWMSGRPNFNLAFVRSFEIASAINRMRSLKVKQEV